MEPTRHGMTGTNPERLVLKNNAELSVLRILHYFSKPAEQGGAKYEARPSEAPRLHQGLGIGSHLHGGGCVIVACRENLTNLKYESTDRVFGSSESVRVAALARSPPSKGLASALEVLTTRMYVSIDRTFGLSES